MKKYVLTVVLLAASVITSEAQQFLGISTSNWCGMNNIELNPANIADSRTRFALNLFSLNVGVDNNLASINLSKVMNAFFHAKNPNLNDIFTFSKSNEFNVILPVADIYGPGLMVSIDDKNSVAITTRIRGIDQFNHFDQNLWKAAMNPGSVNGDIAIKSDNFNWTANVWSEIKLTYAREVYNKGEHYLKGGISLTRLGGIGFLSLKGNNLDGEYVKAQDSIHSTKTDVEFATSAINSTNELTSGLSDVLGQFFGKKGGNGWGADLGMVYEWRPEETNSTDQSSNKYKLRGSLAVTDIGSINYTSLQATITANGSMSTGDFAKSAKNFSNFAGYANSHGYHMDTTGRSTKVHLPTAMIMGVDYYVMEHFYVNGTWITNLANRMNFGNSVYGQVTITPRWDTKYFCVALPLTYSAMTQGIKAGLGFRAGGFIFGSDDMLAFFGAKAYGVNFYVGGFVPINKKIKKIKIDGRG